MSKNWTAIQKKYKGLWVALTANETTVIGAGKTAKEALQKARTKGHKDPILTRMPVRLVAYVG